ncbi:LOW QUALITY PROTEIN: hypothetical protein Cgig2_012124 [Carnegiea gigantea]|uniref:Polygalacturonase inhibitor protein n=1 Tax=Carnegiea gigantea TaxID=171969 RepID=A0A9Q1KSX2_9CARY|nr:LOW QUALITY PROTEIN: hypothetical protein Cgig2_012124 [Carnegiea gigantea]
MVAAPCTLSLLSLLLFLFLSSASQCNPSDMKVLLQLKMPRPTDPAFWDWDPKTAPDCYNINGRVTSLYVLLIFVSDKSHPSLESFLSSNHSTYTTPSLQAPSPPPLATSPTSKPLSLPANRPHPRVPWPAQELKLTHLDLSFNRLNGSIPSTLGQLTNLTYLDLSFNNLSGPIPDSLGQLTGLDLLYLARNRLTGRIPASLSHLTKETQLDLGANRLTDSIPASFGSFKNPKMALLLYRNQYLNVHHNIHGLLPKQLAQLPLKSIDVSYNNLCGEILPGHRLRHFSPHFFAHKSASAVSPCHLASRNDQGIDPHALCANQNNK